jgi:hypothetical protein
MDYLPSDQKKAKATIQSGDFQRISPELLKENAITAPTYKLEIPLNLQIGDGIRPAGKTATEQIDKDAMLALILKERSLVQINRTRRSMKWQAAQIYQTGKINFKADDPLLEDADFKFDPACFAPISSPWISPAGTPSATADPIADIRGLMRTIRRLGHVSRFKVVLTPMAFKGFIENTKVQTWGQAVPNKLLRIPSEEKNDNGMDLVAEFIIDGKIVPFYLYDELYENEKGETVSYLTDGQVLVLPVNKGKYKILFGGVETIGELDESLKLISPNSNINLFGDRKAVDIYISTEKKNGSVWLEMVSRPVLAAVSRNTHGSFNVVAS